MILDFVEDTVTITIPLWFFWMMTGLIILNLILGLVQGRLQKKLANLKELSKLKWVRDKLDEERKSRND